MKIKNNEKVYKNKNSEPLMGLFGTNHKKKKVKYL